MRAVRRADRTRRGGGRLRGRHAALLLHRLPPGLRDPAAGRRQRRPRALPPLGAFSPLPRERHHPRAGVGLRCERPRGERIGRPEPRADAHDRQPPMPGLRLADRSRARPHPRGAVGRLRLRDRPAAGPLRSHHDRPRPAGGDAAPVRLPGHPARGCDRPGRDAPRVGPLRGVGLPRHERHDALLGALRRLLQPPRRGGRREHLLADGGHGGRGRGLRGRPLPGPGLAGDRPLGLRHGPPGGGGGAERLRAEHRQPAGRQPASLLRHRLHAGDPRAAGSPARAPGQGRGARGARDPAGAHARQGLSRGGALPGGPLRGDRPARRRRPLPGRGKRDRGCGRGGGQRARGRSTRPPSRASPSRS